MEIRNCEGKTDEDLVRLTLGDKEYYFCLMKRYEEKLFRYIKRISSANKEDAEDLLQDIFLKAYINLNDFDLNLKFSSWIYRIAHNTVVSGFRKVKARPCCIDSEEKDEFLKNIASEENIEKNLDHEFLKKNIEIVLDKMDEKYREVLILKFLEEKDYKEISDILEKPMGTIATLINRAKKQFKEVIERERIKL